MFLDDHLRGEFDGWRGAFGEGGWCRLRWRGVSIVAIDEGRDLQSSITGRPILGNGEWQGL